MFSSKLKTHCSFCTCEPKLWKPLNAIRLFMNLIHSRKTDNESRTTDLLIFLILHLSIIAIVIKDSFLLVLSHNGLHKQNKFITSDIKAKRRGNGSYVKFSASAKACINLESKESLSVTVVPGVSVCRTNTMKGKRRTATI